MLLRSLVRVGTKAQLCRPQVFPRLFCSINGANGNSNDVKPPIVPSTEEFQTPPVKPPVLHPSTEAPTRNGNGMSTRSVNGAGLQQSMAPVNNASIDPQEPANGVSEESAATSAKPGVEKWTTDDVVNWAKGVEGVRPEDAEILRSQVVMGKSLLTLTKDDLVKPPYSLPGGPAASLALAIGELADEQIILFDAKVPQARLDFINSTLDNIVLPHNPKREFTYAGPANYTAHYCIPSFLRGAELSKDRIVELVSKAKYFVLHEQRQSGKTTFLLELRDYLNSVGEFAALYVNIEAAQQAWGSNLKLGVDTVVAKIESELRSTFGVNMHLCSRFANLPPTDLLQSVLEYVSKVVFRSGKKFVLLVDEIDSLVGDTLLTILRQLRSGYEKRFGGEFPHSIMLVGVRDVREYRIYSDEQKKWVLGGSAFNISSESGRVPRLNWEQVAALFRQHTATTGQEVLPEAIECVMDITEGQPWCVNRVGYQATHGADKSKPLTADNILEAMLQVILLRETHLQNIEDNLQDDRVRAVIEPMIAGMEANAIDNDLKYCEDLGLIKKTETGYNIANQIYKEVIPRVLTNYPALNIRLLAIDPPFYLDKRGRLDMEKLLKSWKDFYLENIEFWTNITLYKEDAYHLLLFAFLQRVINGGGMIAREYALGKKECDILLRKPYDGGTFALGPVQQEAIETKVHRKSDKSKIDTFIAKGAKQLVHNYCKRLQIHVGYLLVVDQHRTEEDLSDRMSEETMVVDGCTVHVYRM